MFYPGLLLQVVQEDPALLGLVRWHSAGTLTKQARKLKHDAKGTSAKALVKPCMPAFAAT